MNHRDLELIIQAGDALRAGGLVFCTRCGSKVDPYQPSASLGQDFHWDYEEPLATAGDLQTSDHRSYHCPGCRVRWYAVGWQDTGYVLPCGHFMPVYAAYCGFCGARAGSA